MGIDTTDTENPFWYVIGVVTHIDTDNEESCAHGLAIGTKIVPYLDWILDKMDNWNNSYKEYYFKSVLIKKKRFRKCFVPFSPNFLLQMVPANYHILVRLILIYFIGQNVFWNVKSVDAVMTSWEFSFFIILLFGDHVGHNKTHRDTT